MKPVSQKVAQVLSGRIPIHSVRDKSEGTGWWVYWDCPCGEPSVSSMKPPFEYKCPTCDRVFIIFDPEREDSGQ